MDAHRTLGGRYRLEAVIGRGGMGTVYRAQDLVLGRAVAVKVLPAHLAEHDPVNVARFENEARAAAALSHPALVAVYDTGTDGDARFIVMELIAGRSLQAILRDGGPFAPEQATQIASEVAGALAAAHDAGIVHRDVKPANVMVADGGAVKVLDFGIARTLDGTTLTQAGTVLGTAAYMAPERAAGAPADARSDVYALGCVLYALLVGHPPFTADEALSMLHQHANVAARPPRAENRAIPAALNALVVRMLAKSPSDRPQTAAEVRDELAALVAGTQSARSGEPVPTEAVAAAELPAAGRRPTTRRQTTEPLEPGGRTSATRRLTGVGLGGRRGAALAAAVGVLVLAVVGLIALASGGGSPAHGSTGGGRAGPASGTTAAHKAQVGRGAEPGGARSTAATRSGSATTTSSAATSSRPSTTSTPTTSSSTTSSSTTSSSSSPPATTATTATGGAATVAQAAGALTALVTQDAQSATIDQPAAMQIGNGVMGVLNAYEMGHAMDVAHMLAALSQQVAMLEQHGDITAAAAPQITSAIAALGTALASSAPPTPAPPTPPGPPGQQSGAPGQQPGPKGQPPGHGGLPPGQAKKHGR